MSDHQRRATLEHSTAVGGDASTVSHGRASALPESQRHLQGPVRSNTSPPAVAYDPYVEDNAAPTSTDLHPNRRQSTRSLSQSPGKGPDNWFPEASTKPTPKEPSAKRLIGWLVTCVAFVILAPVISIVMGVTMHARDMAYPGNDGLPQFNGRILDFEMVLISADPKAGSMRLDWKILGEENSPCRPDNLAACTDVEIMFDTNLLRAEGTHSTQEDILSSSPPDRPIFFFNASAFASGDPYARTPTFRTQVALFSPETKNANLIFYPFDTYAAEIIFFAREVETNNPVGVRIKHSRGIAIGLEVTFGHSFRTHIPPGLVEASITLTRSKLVKSDSIVATIAIWFVTIILALVMITSVFFGFKQRGEVLLIPVATLFAFTQLRQSMPGAPDGFGDIMDLVGLVPCLALLALTAAFSLGAFILTDPTSQPRQIRYKMMRDAFSSKHKAQANVEQQHPEKTSQTSSSSPNTQ